MSRLWADRLHVVLMPGRVTVARLRPFGRRVVSQAVLPLGGDVTRQGALDQLGRYLAEAKLQGLSMRVLLGGSEVQYALVPSQGLTSDDQRNQLILKHYFLSLYGDQLVNWRYSADSGNAEGDVLAAAIRPEVIGDLEHLCKAQGLLLRSVQPALAVVANQWRSRLNQPGSRWLVAVDPQCTWIGLVSDGRWRHLKRYAVFQLNADNLGDAIQRETIFADLETPADCVLLYAPGCEPILSSVVPGLKVEMPLLHAQGDFGSAKGDMPLALAA